MPKIVLSYRRTDAAAIAGRIYDRLASHYGKDSVFMDIDSIPFGVDFREHIGNALANSDILVAIIGPNWLGVDVEGAGRINDETDFVRVEIETALQKKIPVIPVLVERAPMPKPNQLPESLKAFAFRNASDVDSGRDFHSHVDRLLASMDRMLGLETSRTPSDEATKRSIAGRLAVWLKSRPAIAAVALVLAGIAIYFWRTIPYPASKDAAAVRPGVTTLSAAGPLRSGEVVVLDGFANYDRSGFSFRTEQIVGWNSLLGDILVAKSDNGKGEAHFFMPGIASGVSTDNVGDVVKAGIFEISNVSFSEVRACPQIEYVHGWFKPRVGGVYCVIVRDGKSYAKVAVRELQSDRIRFEWVYNPSGQPIF
jgi:hypothetical protein